MSTSKKFRVIIVAMAVSFPNEKRSASRFYSMADTLMKAGYDVLLVTGSFDHAQKSQRNITNLDSAINCRIVYQPSYNRNIGLKRIISLQIFRKNVVNLLKSLDTDVIISTIPDNFTTAKLFKLAEKNKWKKILDIEDLWPEAMEMYLENRKLGFLNPFLLPYRISAWQAYKYADGYIGTSKEYTAYGSRYDKNNSVKPARTIYVGNDIASFDRGVDDNWKLINKGNEFWVTYAGTVGVSYDIKTMIDTAVLLKSLGYDKIVFKILGDGETRKAMETYAFNSNCNVEFLGFQPYEVMAAYLRASDIVVNSFVKDAPQSIVTKIGDYLSSGNPMINTCRSMEMRHLVDHYKIGVNVEAENPKSLQQAIIDLYKAPEARCKMGKNARRLAEKKFDRKFAYKNVIGLMKELGIDIV